MLDFLFSGVHFSIFELSEIEGTRVLRWTSAYTTKEETPMSTQTLHSLVVRFNKLSEGDPEKDSLEKVIVKGMKKNAHKQAASFSLSLCQ